MIRKIAAAACAALLLCACETPTTQRYSISADNNIAARSLGRTGIGIATFAPPAQFDPNCRALGALQVADGLNHTQYIQKAFEDELKLAGAYAGAGARVTLAGKVEKLEFSSSRAVTGGSWTIDLSLQSSNGRNIVVNEYYEFNSGFIATEACRNTAEAYTRAVQNLIGKTFKDARFRSLLD
jgi:hypothetical protein